MDIVCTVEFQNREIYNLQLEIVIFSRVKWPSIQQVTPEIWLTLPQVTGSQGKMTPCQYFPRPMYILDSRPLTATTHSPPTKNTD